MQTFVTIGTCACACACAKCTGSLACCHRCREVDITGVPRHSAESRWVTAIRDELDAVDASRIDRECTYLRPCTSAPRCVGVGARATGPVSGWAYFWPFAWQGQKHYIGPASLPWHNRVHHWPYPASKELLPAHKQNFRHIIHVDYVYSRIYLCIYIVALQYLDRCINEWHLFGLVTYSQFMCDVP